METKVIKDEHSLRALVAEMKQAASLGEKDPVLLVKNKGENVMRGIVYKGFTYTLMLTISNDGSEDFWHLSISQKPNTTAADKICRELATAFFGKDFSRLPTLVNLAVKHFIQKME